MKNNEDIHMLSDDERQQLHECLLNMLCDIDTVCKKNNIQYMLCGGSALGAVRHSGFIPWDDDLDLAMYRTDYEKFISVMEDELGDYYDFSYPNSDNVEVPFLKIYKKNTIMQEVYSNKKYPGIWIDVFPIEGASDYKILRYMKGIVADILHFVAASIYIGRNRNNATKAAYGINLYKKLRFYVAILISSLLPFISTETMTNVFDSFVKKDIFSKWVTIPSGRKHYYGECIPVKVISPLRKIKFESITTQVYGDVNTYLKQLYGDYMKIPPLEKREQHYVTKFYIDKSVKWYVNCEDK